MKTFLWNILLTLLWIAWTGEYSFANAALGFGATFTMLFVVRALRGDFGYPRELLRILRLALCFVYELLLANFRMAYFTVMPLDRIRPGIIAIPLEPMNDAELTMLANLITLTPGTLSVNTAIDPTSGRRVLYVHIMVCDEADETRDSIKRGFERLVLEAMR